MGRNDSRTLNNHTYNRTWIGGTVTLLATTRSMEPTYEENRRSHRFCRDQRIHDPAVAADCTSSKDIDASCARSATVQSQPANAANKENSRRVYAASFYESVMLRKLAATRVDGADIGCALYRQHRL
jgi:hypothetical protein